MSGNSEVLKEYLISLGFKVDPNVKKFDKAVSVADVGIKGLALSLLGVVSATAAMAHQFARSMEGLYYSSVRAEGTVGNLQAITFAAKAVGISSEAMQQTVENVARSLRTSPGLVAWARTLGVTASDGIERVLQLIKGIKRVYGDKPYGTQAAVAENFGIPEDQFFQLTRPGAMEELEQRMGLFKQMMKDAGLDPEKAAKTAVEYDKLFDLIIARSKTLKAVLADGLLTPMTALLTKLDYFLTELTKFVGTRATETAKTVKEATPEGTGYAAYKAATAKAREYAWSMLTTGAPPGKPGDRKVSGVVTDSATGKPVSGALGGAPGPSAKDLRGLAQSQVSGALGAGSGSGQVTDENLNAVYELLRSGATFSSDAVRDQVINNLAHGKRYDQVPLGSGPSSNPAPVIINQQTDIKVSAPDASSAAKAVGEAQSKVNAQMATVVRNSQGGIR